MKVTLLKALLGLVPIAMLFSGAALLFLRTKSGSSLLQLLGAVCLGIVVVAHTCEALGLFPSMGWGEEQSIGHYLDLGSAVLGLTLFSVGYLSHALASRLR